MSQERFSQLIIETMSGQNLLPESHVINLIYQQLYGMPDRTLLSILGSDWLIQARTPYPRLRGSNNLVVPDNKLPQDEKEDEEEVEENEEELDEDEEELDEDEEDVEEDVEEDEENEEDFEEILEEVDEDIEESDDGMEEGDDGMKEDVYVEFNPGSYLK